VPITLVGKSNPVRLGVGVIICNSCDMSIYLFARCVRVRELLVELITSTEQNPCFHLCCEACFKKSTGTCPR
jgi:hypothetical protein